MEHLSVAVNERDELAKDLNLKMHATNKLKEKLQDFSRFEQKFKILEHKYVYDVTQLKNI
jgi:hypothetical protein